MAGVSGDNNRQVCCTHAKSWTEAVIAGIPRMGMRGTVEPLFSGNPVEPIIVSSIAESPCLTGCLCIEANGLASMGI